MSSSDIIPGCIIEWDEYELADGTLDSKIFVIVGALPDKNYLGIRTTSKKRWRTYQPEDGADYYFIPGGKVEWFDLDSWILFSDAQEFNAVMFQKKMDEGKLRILKGSPLRFQIANELCNKMRKCPDVSAHHISLLGPVLQSPQKA